MTDVKSPRSFEYATDGSDITERFCDGFLASHADKLAGGSFVYSEHAGVEQTHSVALLDEHYISLCFSARKTHFNSDKGRHSVDYSATLVINRPLYEGEYWPDMEIADSTEENDAAEDGSLMVKVVGSDELEDVDLDEDYGDDVIYVVKGEIDPDLCTVKEVWEFDVSDDDYIPRKRMHHEYCYMETKVAVEHTGPAPLNNNFFSEEIDEDSDLNVYDTSFTTSFSELDMATIRAICNLDYKSLRAMLEQTGSYTEQNLVLSEVGAVVWGHEATLFAEGSNYFGDDEDDDFEETDRFQNVAALPIQVGMKNIPQALVTCSEREAVGRQHPLSLIARSVLSACISEIRCAEDAPYEKPDPRVISDWLERIGVEPANVVVIGEQGSDAELAINLGARAIIVDPEGDLDDQYESHPDIILAADLDDIVVYQMVKAKETA